jgi:hypothetical protein
VFGRWAVIILLAAVIVALVALAPKPRGYACVYPDGPVVCGEQVAP